MEWWQIGILAGGVLLLLARLWVGPADEDAGLLEGEESFDSMDEDAPEPWTAEALARYGTETSVADLAAQGRTDELRGLGYEGDIPGE